jgi:lipopolysaccharide transport system permease protein
LETAQRRIVIEAGRSETQYWRDLWRYRELLYFLAWRDLLVRYKQTVVGVAWSLIRPLLTMVVFTLVFGKLAKLPSGGVPYPLLVMTGMLPWQFFATAISESGNSLISNTGLVTKVYFPRMVIPASTVITSMADFVISCGFLALLFVWYHFTPGVQVFALPLFVILSFAVACGVGLWIAALMAQYRDFRFIVPFVVQFGLYISPVGFSTSVVPEKWRLLYSLNPMAGIIDGFRWCLLEGQTQLWWPSLVASAALTSFLCLSGIWYFRKTERILADVI